MQPQKDTLPASLPVISLMPPHGMSHLPYLGLGLSRHTRPNSQGPAWAGLAPGSLQAGPVSSKCKPGLLGPQTGRAGVGQQGRDRSSRPGDPF